MSTLWSMAIMPHVHEQYKNAELIDGYCQLNVYRGSSQCTDIGDMLHKIISCKKRLDELSQNTVHECGTVVFEHVRLRHQIEKDKTSINLTRVCIGTNALTIKRLQSFYNLSNQAVSYQTDPHPVDFYVFHDRKILHIRLNPEKQDKVLSIPLNELMNGIWDVYSTQICNLADQLTNNSLLIAFTSWTRIIPVPTNNDLVEALAIDLQKIYR